jgi:hypothetical protein
MRYRKVKPAAMKVRLLELEWDLEVFLQELVVSLKYLPNSLECLTLRIKYVDYTRSSSYY